MYRPPEKQSTGPRTIRFPKQSQAPTYDDITFLMQEGRKMLGKTVELPWATADKKGEYVVSIKYDYEEADPNWIMSQVSSAGNQALWNYQSRDLTLICNLIANSCGGDQLQDLIPSSALFGKTQEAPTIGVGSGTQITQTGTFPASSTSATTGAVGIVFEPPRPGLKATLEGDLNKLQVPNLLQSIQLAKMTGRLDIRTRTENSEVFFQEGIPLHCKLKEVTGDSALVELITWTSGEFRFWPEEKTGERTINKRLDSALMEGVALLDQWKYLETANLRMESCLVKKNAMISEDEFKARLAKGAPIAFEQQLDFYELIDNRNTLFDLLRKRPMNKIEWVPILFNLVSCGLVQVTDQAPTQNRLASLRALGIDDTAVQGVVKQLVRAETGILSYPSFIYFLDLEWLRYEYFNLPFSLVVFSLGQRKGVDGPVEALQMLAVRRAMQRISLVKRHVDFLGHYETFDYALLLPNTNSAAAGALANRIADVLREAPLASDMDSRSLAVAFGVATVPEDCQELDKLLIAAKKARDRAKQVQQRVVLAREVLIQGL